MKAISCNLLYVEKSYKILNSKSTPKVRVWAAIFRVPCKNKDPLNQELRAWRRGTKHLVGLVRFSKSFFSLKDIER